jgi:hypothetical protein
MLESENKTAKAAMPAEDAAREPKRHKIAASLSDEEKCKQALASINTLHGLLRDLIVEMRTFEYPLPLHEVKVHAEEVEDEEGLTKLLLKEKDAIAIKIAKQLDHIFQTNQKISSALGSGLTREAFDRVLYTLQGRMNELKGLFEKYTANRLTVANLNIDWLSADNYTLAYDFVEAVSPFVHDKVDVCVSPAATLSILEKGETSCRFTEGEKQELREDFRMISRLEDLMGCIVNLAVNIDEEINCLVERYLQPGRDLSDDDKRVVQDVRKMLREMTDIEDSLLQGMAVNEAATKGQILGLVAFFCGREIALMTYRELFSASTIFKEYDGTEGPSVPVLSPLQSASCILYYMGVCNEVRRESLLEQTARCMGEARGTTQDTSS